MKKNSTILVTGANGAMAKETIKHLINDGYSNIVMACRSKAKGELAKQEILAAVNNKANLTVVGGFDMNKPDHIEKAVQALNPNLKFDVIFLAAGFAVFEDDYQHVVSNNLKIEKTVFQNLFGSHITLKHLKKNNLLVKKARVIIAGGEGARGIKGMIEKPVFKSAKAFRDYLYLEERNLPKYNPMSAIGVSKLVGALWTRKLAEIEKGNLDVIWFSPGLTSKSDGLKALPLGKRIVLFMMFGMMTLLGKSQGPEAGGRKYADCIEGVIGKNGDLLGAPAGKTIGKITDQTPQNELFTDENVIDELWSVLEETTGEYLVNSIEVADVVK